MRDLIDGLPGEFLSDTPWRRMLESLAHDLDAGQASETEYNRLFVLSFPHAVVQPYGSHWLEQDRRLLGASALEVREMMAAHGLAVREESGLMPDHIVSELEFMAYLASQGDTTLAAQEQLLDRHLARWVPKFTAALREARPSSYYQLAADFLDRLIQWDQVRLPRIGE